MPFFVGRENPRAFNSGDMRFSTTKKDILTETTESDIFYGGKGNDTITGTNGPDVTIYDTTSCGKDIVEKTYSAMTTLFNGLTKNDVTIFSF